MTEGTVHSPAAIGSDSAHVVRDTFAHGGASRGYRLFVPARREGAPRPFLLVLLHGCTQDADDAARGTMLDALADSLGGLVLYPEQPLSAHPQKCWSWYDAAHQRADAGEPALVAAMTEAIAARHDVDRSRIYVAGISAGGAMALTLAAGRSDLYAAAAVHSAVPLGAAQGVPAALAAMREGGAGDAAAVRALAGDRRPAPLMVVHGTADAVVHPKNATAIVGQWAGALDLPAQSIVTATDAHGGERAHTRQRWHPDTAPPLVLWTIDGLGHAWSGGSPEGTYTDPKGPSASRAILDFLLRHRLHAAAPAR